MKYIKAIKVTRNSILLKKICKFNGNNAEAKIIREFSKTTRKWKKIESNLKRGVLCSYILPISIEFLKSFPKYNSKKLYS